jgi:hypothetical protein
VIFESWKFGLALPVSDQMKPSFTELLVTLSELLDWATAPRAGRDGPERTDLVTEAQPTAYVRAGRSGTSVESSLPGEFSRFTRGPTGPKPDIRAIRAVAGDVLSMHRTSPSDALRGAASPRRLSA